MEGLVSVGQAGEEVASWYLMMMYSSVRGTFEIDLLLPIFKYFK